MSVSNIAVQPLASPLPARPSPAIQARQGASTPKRMRFSLSALQSSTSSVNAHLSQKDIEALQKKGILPSTAATADEDDSTIAATTPSSTESHSTSSSSSLSSPPPTAFTAADSQEQPQRIDVSSTSGTPFYKTTPASPQQQHTLYTKPPLPIAARVTPMITVSSSSSSSSSSLSSRSKHNARFPVSKHRSGGKIGGEDQRLVIHHRERLLPAYHHGVIEDTCSHLHVSMSAIRRHSDSSSQLAATSSATASSVFSATGGRRNPLPEDTLAFDPIRRASIATASPVVPSPLGSRTILYKASQAHTLLSLPSRTVMASEASLNSSGTIYEQRYNSSYSPAPTSDMRNFKFPADDRRSQTPPSPALPPTSASLSPVMQVRSKRKSSIPMRSPSVGHSREDDASPGVIFQLPFGTPPIPSTTAFRKASTPSMLSLSVFSAQEAGSTEDDGAGLSSDHLLPENYPSPASSRVNFVADHQRSEPLQEQDQHNQQLTRFETPPSPANRSGLGIQVQESFTEPGATHPLEPASTVTGQQQDSQAQQITFIEGDSSMSIGDIIVAEQHASAAAAQRRGEQPPIEVVEGVSSDQTPQPSSMPTPPPTSRVLPTRVMEANSQQRQESPHMDGSGNRDDNSSRASPPTPFTPAYGFSASHSAAVKIQRVVDSTLTQKAFKASVSGTTESSVAEFVEDGLDQRSSRASSKTPSSKDADQEGSDVVDKDGEDEDDQDQVLDPLGLPLWAQRHLHIRRQSLIPRPELDFVKGSGILPPASKGLVTSGGAVILSYPVLISDMVHVALDDLQAKGVALDGSDASEESEEDAEQPSASSTLSGAAGAALKGTGKFGMRAAKGAAGAKLANHKRRKGIAGQAGKRRGSSAMTAGAKDEYNQSADEYAESEDIEERTQGGGGFMSTAAAGVYNKRRRAANNTKSSTTDAAEALLSVPTRVVPERHGPSVYRRRGSVNGSGIYSPSASPQMGYSSSAASFRQNYSNNNNTGHSSSNSNKKRLGSPVDIDMHYAFEGDGDVVMNELEDEGDDIDIEDEYDGDQHLYSGESYHHRHHHVPEHLRIPPSEVEIAVKLTKEMMESNKRRKLNGKKDHRSNSNHNSSRSALKTLKPLLDATTKADQRRAGRSDDEDEDEDEDEDNNEDDNDNDEDDYEADHQMVQVAASVKTKAGSSVSNGQANTGPGGKKGAKANSNTASGLGSAAAAGASLKQQRAPKSREGKMMTKRCEACGTTETPCWRPGYTPHSALCNSCGLRYKKSNVFCPKVGCKYIPLKTEYAAMEAERTRAGRAHLMCHKCKGPVALPVPKE